MVWLNDEVVDASGFKFHDRIPADEFFAILQVQAGEEASADLN